MRGSVGVLETYQGRLGWVSERDHGQADAIRRGFDATSGEIMAWLNSDDVLLPGEDDSSDDQRHLDRLPGHYGDYDSDDYSSDSSSGPYLGGFPWLFGLNLANW